MSNRRERERISDRLSGMCYAIALVEEKGMEEAKKEMKFRQASYVPIEISTETVDNIFQDAFTRVYNSYGVAVFKVLIEQFGFGKTRLDRFMESFTEIIGDIATVDHYGERLYTFSDYAKEYNKKYDMNFDLETLQEVDELNDRAEGHIIVHAIEMLLATSGYKDAADFLIEYLKGEEE